jgi:hypothetical protein
MKTSLTVLTLMVLFFPRSLRAGSYPTIDPLSRQMFLCEQRSQCRQAVARIGPDVFSITNGQLSALKAPPAKSLTLPTARALRPASRAQKAKTLFPARQDLREINTRRKSWH